MFGCQSNKLYDGLKKDLAPEKEAKIFNKTSSSNNFDIPLNGMIIVKENETIYSIANKYKVIPKDIIEDNINDITRAIIQDTILIIIQNTVQDVIRAI